MSGEGRIPLEYSACTHFVHGILWDKKVVNARHESVRGVTSPAIVVVGASAGVPTERPVLDWPHFGAAKLPSGLAPAASNASQADFTPFTNVVVSLDCCVFAEPRGREAPVARPDKSPEFWTTWRCESRGRRYRRRP
jgi:hypothetical protein